MSIKTILARCYWILVIQVGIDPRRTWSFFLRLPRYFADMRRFRVAYDGPLRLMPCLHDRNEEAGDIKSEYFWQDLLMAREIYEAGPQRHIDIGSRVDGFVAHVASFRQIEILDIRPMGTEVPGIEIRQADVMDLDPEFHECCDSLSCLHALEHFGLGRYGDPVDPEGYAKGLANMAGILKPGGTFYLSVPIGRPRVEFNANHVFDPGLIMRLSEESGLRLMKFMSYCKGHLDERGSLSADDLAVLSEVEYLLGMFFFKKVGSTPVD